MTPARFSKLAGRYADLRIAVVGDFCLDRYFDIDPTKSETSMETGLPVHNVTAVRSHPGAAGTILNNLLALGVGTVLPVGFCGEDGEGYELLRALHGTPRVQRDGFIQSSERRTFSYTKPLIREPGQPPRELSRFDLKNWTQTPPSVEQRLIAAVGNLRADAIIVMDQVDIADTGVVTSRVRATIGQIARARPDLPVLADCRRGLTGWPPCIWKMNARELSVLAGVKSPDERAAREAALKLAEQNHRPLFVTLAERGILAAEPSGHVTQVPAFAVRGTIDIVGAGDAVSANLVAALAAGASATEAMQLAMAAASIVIHQVGTTGTATLPEIRRLLLA